MPNPDDYSWTDVDGIAIIPERNQIILPTKTGTPLVISTHVFVLAALEYTLKCSFSYFQGPHRRCVYH